MKLRILARNRDLWSQHAWGVWCHLFGHKPRPKMYCTICDRCRTVLP